MAVTSFMYGGAIQSLANKEIDFDTDVIKIMLCTSAYVPNRGTHRYKSSVTSEVTGAGYTAGGKTLTNVSITYNSATNQTLIDCDDVSWDGSSISARYAVIYDDTTLNKPLIGYIDFGADIASNNSSLAIVFSDLGTFRLAPGLLTGGQPEPELPDASPTPTLTGYTFALRFNEDFTNGLNTSVWTPYWLTPSTTYRSATTNPSNTVVAGGEAELHLSASGVGAVLTSNPYDGVAGHTGFSFGYGYVEARIWIPGPSDTAAYNWVGMSVRGQNWPTDGQADIVETAGWEASGGFTSNYHWDSDGAVTPVGTWTEGKAGTGNIAGSYANGWHTYGLHRRPDGTNDVYWDNTKVWSYTNRDGGRPQYFVFNVGQSTANQNYGQSSTMRIDYVRYWEQLTAPGTSAGDGVQAAQLLNWGPVVRGDEFEYTGAPDSNKWTLYNSAGHAGNGLRRPAQCTVANGALRITGLTDGTTGGMSAKFDRGIAKFYRVETRMRSSVRHPEYHPVLLFWADATTSAITAVPEIDYAEATSDVSVIRFFLHWYSTTTTSASKTLDVTQWHNYAVEWRTDAVIGYVDGVEWFRDTNTTHVPQEPMHTCIQLDWFPGDSPDTNPTECWMEVAWTREYNL